MTMKKVRSAPHPVDKKEKKSLFFVIFVATIMVAAAVPFLALCGEDMNNDENTALGAGFVTEPMVAASNDFVLTLRSDGTVWAWGYNGDGQLGNGDSGNGTNKNTPVKVSDLTDVKTITTGTTHSLAVKNDGTVWAWGVNNYGQLGNGSTVNSSTPVQVWDLTDVTAIAGGTTH
ncbi:MAG: hypothetical protein FWG19_01530, partial [Methanomassiliicoccaceae archaeon]|nr:hypothetical protein [Methanomassiliicoccaceae archaeon]